MEETGLRKKRWSKKRDGEQRVKKARGIHVAWAMEGQRKTIWEDTLQDACNACKMKRIREERGGRRTDQRK